ncbi:hypothetical protein L0F63_001131 [Massospora cicadina]|nr:hypothetical protein L0F63_001131 [Massospora cicadina]
MPANSPAAPIRSVAFKPIPIRAMVSRADPFINQEGFSVSDGQPTPIVNPPQLTSPPRSPYHTTHVEPSFVECFSPVKRPRVMPKDNGPTSDVSDAVKRMVTEGSGQGGTRSPAYFNSAESHPGAMDGFQVSCSSPTRVAQLQPSENQICIARNEDFNEVGSSWNHLQVGQGNQRSQAEGSSLHSTISRLPAEAINANSSCILKGETQEVDESSMMDAEPNSYFKEGSFEVEEPSVVQDSCPQDPKSQSLRLVPEATSINSSPTNIPEGAIHEPVVIDFSLPFAENLCIHSNNIWALDQILAWNDARSSNRQKSDSSTVDELNLQQENMAPYKGFARLSKNESTTELCKTSPLPGEMIKPQPYREDSGLKAITNKSTAFQSNVGSSTSTDFGLTASDDHVDRVMADVIVTAEAIRNFPLADKFQTKLEGLCEEFMGEHLVTMRALRTQVAKEMAEMKVGLY